jgi:hypothetical protein
MAFQISPGVSITEKDVTLLVPAVATTPAGMVGLFQWGPGNEPVTITSEKELAQIFGKPMKATSGATDAAKYNRWWWSAANFLSYGNNLKVVRFINSTNVSKTSTSGGTAINGNTLCSLTSYQAYGAFAAGNGLYVGIDSTNTATIFNFYNSALQFGTNGSTKMVLDTSGNLGIGSTSPIAKLDISGISTSQNGLRLTATSGGQALAAFTADTSTGEIRIGGTVAAAGAYFPVFYANGGEKARIDTSGNLLVNAISTGAFFDAKINSYSPNTYSPFAGKQGEAAAAVMVQWNSAASGDNIFTYFIVNDFVSIKTFKVLRCNI